MSAVVNNLVIGQGLAGSAVAWTLHWSGESVLIVDRGEPATASRVSAGLITPLTGKRLVKSEDFLQYWHAATKFYRRVEAATGQDFFEEGPMLRLFRDEAVRSDFLDKSDPELARTVVEWKGKLQERGQIQHGIVMETAARLNVKRYQTATRNYFEDKGCFVQGQIEEQTNDNPKQMVVAGRNIEADRQIYCTGAVANKRFPEVPNNRSRGDILEVSIPDYQRQEVIHRSIWVAPENNNRQLVGSTYDWINLTNEPTTEGRNEVLGQLSRMIEGEVKVHSQRAAVRPTMKDFEPVVGQHPDHQNIFVLNGLGSKGVLRSPLLAERLLGKIKNTSDLPPKQDYRRLLNTNHQPQKPLKKQAQEAVAEVLKAGDSAIDGTVGNGHDTSFLAETVGQQGRVIGFDLQQQAIESTQKRLAAQGLSNVELRPVGHENIGELSAEFAASAIMFNLGYLPRSDKTIVTKASTSVAAITAAFGVLAAGGVMTILAYRGHDGGPEEFAAIEQLLQTKSEGYDLVQRNSQPPKPSSPVLFIIRKTTS